MTDTSRLTTALSDRYRIERQIGTGGMATVYLARDIKHDRLVALKVLRPELAAVIGADRFLHEIKVTANLQHPHILPLHDSGEADSFLFYIMPYVEGETLRERLQREKQLGIEDAIEIARAIASALDYAHRHGVIHRDIKPENILLHDGQPTIADFGIALAVSHAAGQRLTETGLSLGTPQYMSPEQAMGDRELDARSDIYSLGVLLYEMLTGDPPYTGSTAQAIVAKVITEKAPLVTAARDTVPPHVAMAIHKALAKLPADRFPSAAAFSEALARPGLVDTSAVPIPDAARRDGARNRTRLLVGVGAGVALGIVAGWLLHRPEVLPVQRFNISIPGLAHATFGPSAVLSPDGAAMAFRAVGSTGEAMLFYRRFDQPMATPLAGTEGGQDPSFSPDGQTVLFAFSPRGLGRVGVNGGGATRVSDSAGPSHTWGTNGQIYFTEGVHFGLSAISAEGGPSTPLSPADQVNGEAALAWPQVLPGNHALIFSRLRPGTEGNRIEAFDLRTRTRTALVPGMFARYAAGHLLVVRPDGALVALPFDLNGLRVTGPPVFLAEGVLIGSYGSAEFSIADNGTLLYQVATGARGLTLVDRTGAARLLPGDVANVQSPRVSPDGRRIAVALPTGGNVDIWVYDFADTNLMRLTLDSENDYPSWTPDGRSVLFDHRGEPGSPGLKSIVRKPVDGSAPAALLFSRAEQPEEIEATRDGRGYLYRQGDLGAGGTSAIRYRPVGGKDEDDIPLIAGQYAQRAPALSPDGRWLAYVSNESSRDEVYVRPFPGPGGRQQVSTGGGAEPRWNPRGGELFFRNAGHLIAAAVDTRPTFSVRGRHVLFADARFAQNNNHTEYDVMPDGQHFVMVSTGSESQGVVLVLNWLEELKAKAKK